MGAKGLVCPYVPGARRTQGFTRRARSEITRRNRGSPLAKSRPTPGTRPWVCEPAPLALVPVFGPTKTGRPRTISLSSAIIALLRTHRQHQRELRMANRPHYHDHDLVFAKEWSDLQRRTDCLGGPLQINNLGQREYATLIKAAEVKPIKFHGLRHTCATLLLKAGTPVHVVSERLGHKPLANSLKLAIVLRNSGLVRKGGFEPPRYCYRQPLKLKAVNVDQSRPRKIGVGCTS